MDDVRRNLEYSLADRIARDQLQREPRWTESLAVGSVRFLEQLKPENFSRQETQIIESTENVWVLQEEQHPYNQKSDLKIDSKA